MADLLDAQGIFAVIGPWVVAFALVLGRVVGLMLTTPLLSSPLVPGPIKAALAGAMALFVTATIGVGAPSLALDALSITGVLIGELVIGAVMGLAVTIAFGALHFCGQMVGIQMGFAIANVVDPANFEQVGVVAQVLNLLGLMLFVTFDGHLLILRAFFDSFGAVPLGGGDPQVGAIVAEIIRQSALLFSIGLRIALPMVCVVMLVNVGLATIARTVPQVNIFVIGFMITISLGLFVLAFSVQATATVFEGVVEDAVRGAIRITKLF